MIFRAPVSACGAAATGTSQTSLLVSVATCDTTSSAVRGPVIRVPLGFAQRGKRLFTMGLTGPNHHLVRRCFAGFLARVHELRTVGRPLCSCAIIFVGDNRNLASIHE